MSGLICPECGSFDIKSCDEENKIKNRCIFCNWKGDALSREILSDQIYADLEKIQKKKKLNRDNGKLFFVRVFVDYLDSAIEEFLLKYIEISNIENTPASPPYFYIETSKKPTEKNILELKKNKHIIDIKIY